MQEKAGSSSFADLARRSFPPVLVVLVRVVHDAAVAFDLATEATARARFEWDGSAGDRWLRLGQIRPSGLVKAEPLAVDERGRT
jgi:hypothetical protein